ncbi:hypothetical protein Lal_00024746 [Lupinus albus]|nr:hypothetical protein Lal_00024746 [Lupinus albus]
MESRIATASLKGPLMQSWFKWASINFGCSLLVTETLMELAWTLVESNHMGDSKQNVNHVDYFSADLGWRRKVSPELENGQHFILNSNSNLTTTTKTTMKSQRKKRSKGKRVLVEDKLVGPNQLKAEMEKQSDLESIGADFESEIFDHLLNELIDQLLGNPLKTWQLQNLKWNFFINRDMADRDFFILPSLSGA